MFRVHRKEIDWAGRKLVIETGKIARQADGAVMVSYGETTVLATVCAGNKADESIDFFPLSVHYLEKAFAVGKIPGGFIKRETKPSDREVLTARLIDRPIRPLFPENYFNEVQIICTTLTYDQVNDAEIPALVAASAALAISGLPFLGPIAAARVGYRDGSYILNPVLGDKSELDLVVAGTEEGVLMVESEAKELSEETMLGAVVFGHTQMQPILKAIQDLAKEVGKSPVKIEEDPEYINAYKAFKKDFEKEIKKAYEIKTKTERYAALSSIKEKAHEKYGEAFSKVIFSRAFESIKANVVRTQVLRNKVRVDGRDLVTIRPIENSVAVLPRVHGSALFTRGETQALVVATLGTASDEQLIDSLEGEFRERFMLHYNFNPYSVGETRRMGAPGRREIGHGRLAWRAINPLIPTKDKFSYAMRVVSEITESNGSSSMATVCGTSLALMDAGVPLQRPVAGIAMGLIKAEEEEKEREGEEYVVLSDILGDEDHLGDMDFKVAGTSLGITALQMDIKITSITAEIMDIALKQAKDGRMHILAQMEKAITASRAEVSDHAPSIETIKINRERIRDLIGPGGKTIRELTERFQVKIDINDEGEVTIAGLSKDKLDAAVTAIRAMFEEPEIGKVYNGVVTKIMDFGAFVKFLGEREGLVHVSEITGERVERVSEFLKNGQAVEVKFVGFDDRGKVRLSMRGLYKPSK